MKRVWPIIAVADVAASAKWYMSLLAAQQTHPGGTTFDQIVDKEGLLRGLPCGESAASLQRWRADRRRPANKRMEPTRSGSSRKRAAHS